MEFITNEGNYKKISLYVSEIEEYEVALDNIGELIVKIGSVDISTLCKVELKLSKEALVGFGNYSIRLSCAFSENYHCHIEPLGNLISNQAFGFFLTPESSEFVIGCKNFGDLNYLGFKNSKKTSKFAKKYNTFKISYLVDLSFDNDYFEYHNLGFNNIGELKVFKGNEDVSKRCSVVLKLSKNGLLGLGTELLRLAHNYDETINYLVNPINKENLSSELGFFLLPSSASLSLSCKSLKDVFYYDSEFGTS